jgi:hypothetical protein
MTQRGWWSSRCRPAGRRSPADRRLLTRLWEIRQIDACRSCFRAFCHDDIIVGDGEHGLSGDLVIHLHLARLTGARTPTLAWLAPPG